MSTTKLAVALEHHRAGRLKRAEALYRKFLRKAPENPNALHLLGVIAAARGDPDQAIQLIGKAVAAVPDFAEGHSNLGNALRAVGRFGARWFRGRRFSPSWQCACRLLLPVCVRFRWFLVAVQPQLAVRITGPPSGGQLLCPT